MLRLLVICVLILNVFATPVFAADIDCKNALETCPPTPDPCACKSNPPSPVEIEGPAVATAGSVFAAKAGTGRAAFHYSIDAGSIDEFTGVVTSAPECPQSTTVTVTDACEQEDQMVVEIAGDELAISGTDEPVVGTQFSASGGSAPYVWSFDGGSIDDSGVIIAINDCGASWEPRWATVTVTDACGELKSLEVRLLGGSWVEISNESYSVGDCSWGSSLNCPEWGTRYPTRTFSATKAGFRYKETFRLTDYWEEDPGIYRCNELPNVPTSGEAFDGLYCQNQNGASDIYFQAFLIYRVTEEWECQ